MINTLRIFDVLFRLSGWLEVNFEISMSARILTDRASVWDQNSLPFFPCWSVFGGPEPWLVVGTEFVHTIFGRQIVTPCLVVQTHSFVQTLYAEADWTLAKALRTREGKDENFAHSISSVEGLFIASTRGFSAH